MRIIRRFIHYLNYLLHAKNEHSVHSPYVYDLYTNVIKETKPYYIFANIESVRAKLLLNTTSISVVDYGTGNSSRRKISKIAHTSLKNPKAAELLFRLVNHFNPKTILEFGTSLGITSAYLASVSSKTQVHTIEGCPQTAEIAQQTFDILKLSNVNLHIGAFDQTLDKILSTLPSLDFVFIDGNHRREPTIKYFETCLKKTTENSILVLDDIHWSTEMNEAWEVVKSNPKVSVSIDLYELGLIILDTKLEKQHYVLRF